MITWEGETPPLIFNIMNDFTFMYPPALMEYIMANGWHFGKKASDFAASLMRKKKAGSKDETEPIKPFTKEEVDELLKKHGVTLEHNQLCDYVYVANKAKADYWGSSIEDEKHLALHIKDEIDDVDRAEGLIMKMWYTMVKGNGISVPWYELID